MTYRSDELAKRAQREQLAAETRDLERRLDELEARDAELAAALEREREAAWSALRHSPGSSRWVALGWLLVVNGTAFVAATRDPPLRWVLLGAAFALIASGAIFVHRKVGSKKEREATDEALREQLVEIARVRVSASPAEPEDLEAVRAEAERQSSRTA